MGRGIKRTSLINTEFRIMHIKSMAEYVANGETPEVLFWVGCAGSFDQRAQRITKAFAQILDKVGVKFAILGKEEMCTGDPARRAGNEFLFQMMAYNNIQTLNSYGVTKIVTACPHCFNIIKNEYPPLGGTYEVIHHTTFLQQLINEGRVKLKAGGAQMFKEEEPGNTRVNFDRSSEALETGANIIAANCPFCTTMLTDGVKN